MRNIKVKSVGKKILALLVVPFMLSGCAPLSECEVPTSHVHKFYANTIYGTVYNYLDTERMTHGNYNWTEDYIDITKDDEAFFRTKGDLFDGAKNWNYLYNYMACKNDYLEFWYSYDEEETSTDEDGNTVTETHHYSGWTDNPYHRGVTGETSLCHHRFASYRIVYKNGKYVKEQSPYVDDIRDVLTNYPYVDQRFDGIVSKTYYLNSWDLPRIKASDFNYFKGPRLEDRTLNGTTK